MSVFVLVYCFLKNISNSSSIVGKMLSSKANPSQEHRKPLKHKDKHQWGIDV